MMGAPREVSIPKMLLRAFGLGLVIAVVLPLVAMFAALGLGHLAGDCGPGSSGGCEMGAALLALYATVPGFLLGAGYSLYRDLRGRRA